MIDVDIKNYLPYHIANIDEFQKLAKVYDKFLKLIWARLDVEEQNRYLTTMDKSECEYWEKILNIEVSSLDSLADRRHRIKGFCISDLPYTEKKLRETLNTMCGKDNYNLVIDHTKYTLKCGLKLVSIQMLSIVTGVIRKMIPANMSIYVYAEYNRWKRFKPLKWKDLKTEKWKSVRSNKKWQEE